MQLELFKEKSKVKNSQEDAKPVIKATASEAPVFGVPANWISFGRHISEYLKASRKGDGSDPSAHDVAKVSFLYRLEFGGGQTVRLRCPALEFDREGVFREIWEPFVQTARSCAERMAGQAFGEGDSCITTAWQGETRHTIRNAE